MKPISNREIESIFYIISRWTTPGRGGFTDEFHHQFPERSHKNCKPVSLIKIDIKNP